MSAVQAPHVRLQEPAVVAELLARMREGLADIAGAVVASHDGLVVAANIDPELDVVAVSKTSAMAAVAAGLGTQFVEASSSGPLQAVTFEGRRGCSGVFPLTSALVLVLLSRPKVTMGRFMVASKQALATMLGPQPDDTKPTARSAASDR